MKNKFIKLGIALMLTLSLTACQSKTKEPEETKVSEITEETEVASEEVEKLGSEDATENSQQEEDTKKPAGKLSSTDGLDAPSTRGALQVKDAKLCGADGNPIQLRGMSTHGLAWFPQYVNSQAFHEFRYEWGANVVRLALYPHENGGYCAGGDQASLMQLVKDGVSYATENDLYVIIDWHVLNEGDPNTYKDQAMAFWQEISATYADSVNVIYEICNEPCNGTSWDSIKSYAETILPIIRANDPDAVVIVGTPNWSQDVDVAAQNPITGYDNICYALHFYAATHKEWLQEKMQTALDAGLPIFASEFGICDASGNGSIDTASADQWISLLDQNGISYLCWSLSNKDETASIFLPDCQKTSGFMESDLSGQGSWLYQMLKNKAGF